jgi:hypothetical protein
MNIGSYSTDEKTEEGDKADDQNVEYTGRYSDAIFILKFLHSLLEFGVLNI